MRLLPTPCMMSIWPSCVLVVGIIFDEGRDAPSVTKSAVGPKRTKNNVRSHVHSSEDCVAKLPLRRLAIRTPTKKRLGGRY